MGKNSISEEQAALLREAHPYIKKIVASLSNISGEELRKAEIYKAYAWAAGLKSSTWSCPMTCSLNPRRPKICIHELKHSAVSIPRLVDCLSHRGWSPAKNKVTNTVREALASNEHRDTVRWAERVYSTYEYEREGNQFVEHGVHGTDSELNHQPPQFLHAFVLFILHQHGSETWTRKLEDEMTVVELWSSVGEWDPTSYSKHWYGKD